MNYGKEAIEINNSVNFLHLMGSNGWQWYRYDECMDDDYDKYKAAFLGTYYTEVFAVVSAHSKHLCIDGHFGILWLEVAGYPDCTRDENNGYTFSDLEDMKVGLIHAEENLIRCGVPFTPDYKFHGKNKANLKRRNDAIRRRLNLDEIEKKAFEESEKGIPWE